MTLPSHYVSFSCGSDSRESACNAGDTGSMPRSGRSPGEGSGNPLQEKRLYFLDFEDCKGKPPQHQVSSISSTTYPKYSQNNRDAGFRSSQKVPRVSFMVSAVEEKDWGLRTAPENPPYEAQSGEKSTFLWRAPASLGDGPGATWSNGWGQSVFSSAPKCQEIATTES